MKEFEQDQIVDLLIWLEKTGREGNTKQAFENMLNGKSMTCKEIGYYFSRIESDGLLEVRFFFPEVSIQQVTEVPLEEIAAFSELVDDEVVRVDIEEHKKYGRCLVVHRFHYIPKDQRDKWIGSKVVAVEEQEMLCKLLNRRNP